MSLHFGGLVTEMSPEAGGGIGKLIECPAMNTTSDQHGTTRREAARSLQRLLPRLEASFAAERAADRDAWDVFRGRLAAHFEALFGPLLGLYGGRYDFFHHLERLLELAARSWFNRSGELRSLDAAREADPTWFRSHAMMGAVCYVDLFAGNLADLRAKLPYLEELGVTYLHLMPLFVAPAGNSDGGYAVSSYREVAPALGTMAELADLATKLRRQGVSLVLDFVFNHTSDEHAWACAALADPDGEDLDGTPNADVYLMFPDRALADAYEAHLRDIFPDQRPGSFTWRPDVSHWVWTTFNAFQ